MPNGRKEPWEELGYIAPTGSRVITKDPLSSLTEPDSALFKWLNNMTAYAKAEEATEKAHQNKMEIRSADTKDATKLQKMQAQQSMAELSERFGHDMTLEQSRIFRAEVETMREQAEEDPHGASSRAESMLLDPKLPPEMRSLLQSSSTLFKQKSERKDERVALAEEMHKYISAESALEYTQKDFNSKVTEKFSDGTSKLTVGEQNFYLGQRDTALKAQRAREPYQQRVLSDLRAEFFSATANYETMKMAMEGTFSSSQIETAENAVRSVEKDLNQALAGRFEDIGDPKYTSTAKFYEAIVLSAGHKLTDELSPELDAKFHQQAADAYLESIGKKPKKDKPLKLEEIREKGISIKPRDVVTVKNYVTGEEKTVEGSEANKLIKQKKWDLVAQVSTALPHPKGYGIEVGSLAFGGPMTAGTSASRAPRFPRSVKEGFILQDSKEDADVRYEIVRIFTDEDGVQKAVLKNIKTGDHLTPLTYSQIFAQYTGVAPAVE